MVIEASADKPGKTKIEVGGTEKKKGTGRAETIERKETKCKV